MPGPPDAPFVSIVVTVKNAAGALGGLLEDLKALDWPHDRLEIVLVDAFSDDGTWEIVRSFAERAPFRIEAVQKEGRIGAGRNEGFRRAQGDFVAVTDADMRVPADWIAQLMEGMDAPDIGVVGGPNDSATDDLTARSIACIPVHGPSVGEVPVVRRSRYRADFTTDSDIYACVTRNSLFRMEAFQAAGAFDESLVATEDPELNMRILKAGYRLRYRRAAGVKHVHRDSLGAFYRQQKNYAVGQAHANRRHPEMRSIKQAAPSIAAFAFLVCLTLGLVDIRFVAVAAALAALALLGALAYGVRAAIVKRDPTLAFSVPAYFIVWQMAWVVGFPQGQWSRPRED